MLLTLTTAFLGFVSLVTSQEVVCLHDNGNSLSFWEGLQLCANYGGGLHVASFNNQSEVGTLGGSAVRNGNCTDYQHNVWVGLKSVSTEGSTTGDEGEWLWSDGVGHHHSEVFNIQGVTPRRCAVYQRSFTQVQSWECDSTVVKAVLCRYHLKRDFHAVVQNTDAKGCEDTCAGLNRSTLALHSHNALYEAWAAWYRAGGTHPCHGAWTGLKSTVSGGTTLKNNSYWNWTDGSGFHIAELDPWSSGEPDNSPQPQECNILENADAIKEGRLKDINCAENNFSCICGEPLQISMPLTTTTTTMTSTFIPNSTSMTSSTTHTDTSTTQTTATEDPNGNGSGNGSGMSIVTVLAIVAAVVCGLLLIGALFAVRKLKRIKAMNENSNADAIEENAAQNDEVQHADSGVEIGELDDTHIWEDNANANGGAVVVVGGGVVANEDEIDYEAQPEGVVEVKAAHIPVVAMEGAAAVGYVPGVDDVVVAEGMERTEGADLEEEKDALRRYERGAKDVRFGRMLGDLKVGNELMEDDVVAEMSGQLEDESTKRGPSAAVVDVVKSGSATVGGHMDADEEKADLRSAFGKVRKFERDAKDVRFGQMLGDLKAGNELMEEYVIEDIDTTPS